MTGPISAEFLTLQQHLAGRYSIERELGRGGMGIVLLARCESHYPDKTHSPSQINRADSAVHQDAG